MIVDKFSGKIPTTKNKYRNKKCYYNNIKFDSMKERDRYIFLNRARNIGQIIDLETHVKYPIHMDGKLICKYIADFVYKKQDPATKEWVIVVEDVKGVETPIFRLKRRMMQVVWGVDVRVVKTACLPI